MSLSSPLLNHILLEVKNAQPSIILSRTFHNLHTRTLTYGYDTLGEPTRPEVRSSEHFSDDQGSSGRPKELATIAGSRGQGSQLFRWVPM